MKAMVTGANGFIGANVVLMLLRENIEVRAFVREKSDIRVLAGLDVELVYGDLRDPASVKTAVRGCDALFHAAALYTLWTRVPEEIYATNVAGTETVMEAAIEQGIEKIVYTSSESTVACVGDGTVATETGYTDPNCAPGDYKRSKCLAEQLVLKLCQAGLPAVIVNPTTPLGPHDYKPTPTGRIVVDFLNGRMPAYVEAGFNFVDVEDVAAGHLLALKKGTPGQRYLLGNRNMMFKEILDLLGQISGRKPPRWRLPLRAALAAAYADEFVRGKLLGREPRIPVAGVKAAGKRRFFDCSKARRELGLPQTPIPQTLEKAVDWFRTHGYVNQTIR
ncbi:MAG: hopanoid-associated sugar epimerase [Solirubrobacterales bacterium]